MTTPRLRGGRRLLAVATVAALGSLGVAGSALADVTGTGGGAYLANATLTTTGLVNSTVHVGPIEAVTAPAPPLATSPTTNSATLLSGDATALQSVGVFVAAGSDSSSTSGATGTTNLGPTGAVNSSSTLTNTTVLLPSLLGGTGLTATTISSSCSASDAGATGSTTIVNGGVTTGVGTSAALDASPAPNTHLATISFTSGLATVTIDVTLNEQTVTNVIGTASIDVNAIHLTETVTLAGQTQTLDLILGHSSCSVTGADVNSAVAAQVRSFTARSAKHGVQLAWRMAQQIDVAGYNVYREVRGHKVRVNKHLIPARQSGRYSFFDHARRAGARYWLQTVNLDGSRSWHGPARLLARRAAA
jgi:hypothetical protein